MEESGKLAIYSSKDKVLQSFYIHIALLQLFWTDCNIRF